MHILQLASVRVQPFQLVLQRFVFGLIILCSGVDEEQFVKNRFVRIFTSYRFQKDNLRTYNMYVPLFHGLRL